MQINTNNYSIAEILDMLRRRELVVNREYQRGSGLWPVGPSSYFIDTILEGFPFPKIYMYEYLARPEMSMRKEIVDGQQRVNTINRFRDNEFALVGESRFRGRRFDDLEDEDKQRFLSYAVSVDVIRNAAPADILQMFRRMNAYTLPLNEAERRHSIFQGRFKWFVNGVTDSLNEFFVEFGVFANREIVRMADAELITECVLAIERGVVSTSPVDLRGVYQRYDEAFPHEDEYRVKIESACRFIAEQMEPLRRSRMMKPYALHSLITALIHAKYGIPAVAEQMRVPALGEFARDSETATASLLALAEAHEAKELDGPFGRYVWGATGGTNRAPRRTARVAWILRALGAEVPVDVDANLA